MRPRIVFHIFRKDLIEMLRDRRTVIMAFVVPALIYPVLFTLLGSVASDKRGELERTRARVAVWGPLAGGRAGGAAHRRPGGPGRRARRAAAGRDGRGSPGGWRTSAPTWCW